MLPTAIVRLSFAVLVLLVACRPSAQEARGLLASPDPVKRQEGATVLQKAYGKDPVSLGDHGEAYWASRLARVRGLPASAALDILEHPTPLGSEAGGGGATENYRLDDFWEATLHRSTRGDDIIFGYDAPRRDVRHVDVQRPEGFTGTWTTYFVNGAVYEAVEFQGGVRCRDRVGEGFARPGGHLESLSPCR